MLRKRHCTGVKPAVNDIGDALHGLSAVRAGDIYLVNVRTVQLDIVAAPALVSCGLQLSEDLIVIGALFPKLRTAADTLALAALALPDRQRSSPVTVSAESPVLNVGDPFAETALADRLRDPVDGIVVADQIILDLAHGNVPGLSCVIKERCIAAPAVRIAVLENRRVEEQAALFQIL